MAKKITWNRAEWSPEAAELIRRAQPHAEAVGELVEQGALLLYSVHADGKPLGVFTARIDNEFSGQRSLFILQAVSVDAGAGFIRILDGVTQEIRQALGLDSVSVSCDRSGMAAQLVALGFGYSETIFVKGGDHE